jgi:putative flippase GtrA
MPALLSVYKLVVERILSTYSHTAYKASTLLSFFWSRFPTFKFSVSQENDYMRSFFQLLECLHDSNMFIKVHEQEVAESMLRGKIDLRLEKEFIK